MAGPNATSDGTFAAAFAGFDGNAFRSGIRTAMLMSMPDAVSSQPIFHFPDDRVPVKADASGEPLDWNTTNVTGNAPKRTVQVTCLIEDAAKPMATESPVGPFRMDRGTLYFFETEWAQVKDFITVDIDTYSYYRTERLLPITLFDATLQRVNIEIDDKS